MDITPIRYTPPTPPKAANSAAVIAPVVEIAAHQNSQAAPIEAVSAFTEKMPENADRARLEAIERAAASMQRAFPELETFTIFKNTAGEFVTRITNRTKGTVQYLPEQNMLQNLVGKQAFHDKVLELNA